MADAARVRFPPPLVYALSTGAGFALHLWLRPWPLPGTRTLHAVAAGVLLLAAFVAALGALRRFRATRQDPLPWTPTPELIVDGIYRYSRNPMYLAMGLVQAAAAAAFANAWILALLPLSFAAVFVIAVRPEERYLGAKFGESYARYRASVRRWI